MGNTPKRPRLKNDAVASRAARPVLSVASECAPLVKTGGLADVVGALPKALAAHGWDMRVLVPAYRGVLKQLKRTTVVWSDRDLFGGPARIALGSVHGTDVLALDAPHLFDRPGGPYHGPHGDHLDNDIRFAALSWAAAQIAQHGTSDSWQPLVVHAHDWQAGLTPAYLTFAGVSTPTIMTIHNIAFQGITGADRLSDLRLPASAFHPASLEYHGYLSTLKAGLVHAHRVTTVSPTYAEELMRPEFGFGLEGVLAARAGDFVGIVNGIDTDVWDPATDRALAAQYHRTSIRSKATNRRALMEEFSLSPATGPVAVVVTRLSHQKGIDLLVDAIPSFVDLGGSIAILGSGDRDLESALTHIADLHPGRVGVRIGYDEQLSHRMFAGGDAVIIPSRFEPCGLTQLYGMRYGSIPVVAATGGLRDTVIDASVAAVTSGAATGIVFSPIDELGLATALRRLVTLFADRRLWQRVQKRAMATEVSWGASARRYADLYEELTP